MRSRPCVFAAALVSTLAADLVTPAAQAGITIDPNAVPGVLRSRCATAMAQ
ncbi:hypothetical protein [Corynebacterium striatum]|uniref:hypothetical protein n=1 Tax=Corynebacterium striatum TaxID=43770 RepID=UPI001559B21C|nr:hypothetical protein [Corynebacterium striatum]